MEPRGLLFKILLQLAVRRPMWEMPEQHGDMVLLMKNALRNVFVVGAYSVQTRTRPPLPFHSDL